MDNESVNKQQTTDMMKGNLDKEDFCYPYIIDKVTGSIVSVAISFLISIINLILRVIVVSIIKKIRLNQESQVVREVVTMIFIS